MLRLLLGQLLLLFSFQALAVNVNNYIPTNAYAQVDTLFTEQQRLFPDHPMIYYFPALVEHESCVSLTNKRCWNSTARLKTAREEGAGLGQLTRAYEKNGALRFDALAEIRKAHRKELFELSWGNIYSRPDLQLRAIVLKVKDDTDSLYSVTSPFERMYMADSAYNGGMGGLRKERKLCGLKKGCDPQRWFGNVEMIKAKSTKPLYAGRSAWDINRHHVKDVVFTRAPKYKNLYLYRGYMAE